jgi:hypothetical protein
MTSHSTISDSTPSLSNDHCTPRCNRLDANKARPTPSFLSWGSLSNSADIPSQKVRRNPGAALKLFMPLLAPVLAVVCLLSGCGSDAPATKTEPAAPVKPAAPAVPEDIQAAAQSLLGTETQVLLFGDLAKTGNQQFLAANVVPKTPKNDNIAGTIVTRAVVGENQDGKWTEIFRCDEHLKNTKGFLGLSPISQVAGWRIQYEQDPVRGLQLYFTPVATAADPHVLPLGVRWNPKVKRYQTMDRNYEHFLNEAANLGDTPRSTLR